MTAQGREEPVYTDWCKYNVYELYANCGLFLRRFFCVICYHKYTQPCSSNTGKAETGSLLRPCVLVPKGMDRCRDGSVWKALAVQVWNLGGDPPNPCRSEAWRPRAGTLELGRTGKGRSHGLSGRPVYLKLQDPGQMKTCLIDSRLRVAWETLTSISVLCVCMHWWVYLHMQTHKYTDTYTTHIHLL